MNIRLWKYIFKFRWWSRPWSCRPCLSTPLHKVSSSSKSCLGHLEDKNSGSDSAHENNNQVPVVPKSPCCVPWGVFWLLIPPFLSCHFCQEILALNSTWVLKTSQRCHAFLRIWLSTPIFWLCLYLGNFFANWQTHSRCSTHNHPLRMLSQSSKPSQRPLSPTRFYSW